jgi:hypothetical protein
MLRGRLLAESLRVGMDLEIADLKVVRLGRHDVSESTTPFEDVERSPIRVGSGATASQPKVWTFVDFEAPAERADELAQALAGMLERQDGWWADFTVGDDRVVVGAVPMSGGMRGGRSLRFDLTSRSDGGTPAWRE